jgi:Tfp pilus assembly protein PilV
MIQHSPQYERRRPATRRVRRAGFTLIEAALTTMIVGVGLVATLQLLASGTTSNIEGTKLTTGLNLAKNIRELTLKNTFAEVRALNGTNYQPPRDSRGEPVASFGTWQQSIKVQPVDPDRLTTDIIDADPDVVRVSVTVTHNGEHACDMSWYRFKPGP